eukprot:gnl/Spiro4/22066_TR10854_c0_g1_i1.p1 gnl/Spiro4/22066_TR10854_c0_g1~~gnl/Spiro4/22066_TR10854_c0_g1_i1.p1  ORF type:complete len:211 (-),score=57.61 gnl/Spiro4/22066_TR10854_c0_g1_i1:259-864(-)
MASRGTLVKIMPGALVAQEAELVGDITIGAGTIVHPKCEIRAVDGPIIIGDDNILEERVVIENKRSAGEHGICSSIQIGSHNVFEMGCRVECATMGDANIVEPQAVLGRHTYVGSGCVIGTRVMWTDGLVPNNTVVHSPPANLTRLVPELREQHVAQQRCHLEVLRKLFPQYLRVRGPEGQAPSSSSSATPAPGASSSSSR